MSTRRSTVAGTVGWTYKTCAFEQIEAQLNNDVVLVTENFRDLTSYPPEGVQVSSENWFRV
jgi:hypothetical protein